MFTRPVLSLLAAISVALLFASSSARADPLFDWGEDRLEDAYVDGDFDEDDHIASRLSRSLGSSDARGTSWLSVGGFYKSLESGKNDLGGILVLGLAFDRIAAGPVHRTVDAPKPLPPPAPLPSPSPPRPEEKPVVLVAPSVARECVAAALRTSGLGETDERIESLIARSRASAWLPETRMRAMRLWTDADHSTVLASTDTANFYDAVGANLVLELRLTWRLDRLVFAGDEPTLERVRLERIDARSRLAARTLEALFAWERAKVEGARAEPASDAKLQSEVRAGEEQASLDVLTGGWFSEAVSKLSPPSQ